MKLKKIVSLALAGIMAVSMLTACGEGDSNSTVTPPVDNTTSTGLSAQLGAEASDLTNSKVTFADSTALNNALKHAVGNIGDRSISQAFIQGINDVTYLGDLQVWGAVSAAVGVLEDDMDVNVDMIATNRPVVADGVAATVNGLNPSNVPGNVQYNENNYNTVMLFAVDSGVEMTNIIEQLSDLIDDDMDDLVTSFNVNTVNNNDQHEVSYHYTCSVASTSKTFVDADTTFGVTFVAVEINRVLGV